MRLANRELEYTMLGELMCESLKNKAVIAQLGEDDFTTLHTQQIFAEIKRIVMAGGEADLVSVTARLDDKAANAATHAAGCNIGWRNAKQHAAELKTYTAKRKIATTAQSMLNELETTEPIELCDKAVRELRQAMPVNTATEESLDSILLETYALIGEKMGGKGNGVKIGLTDFDRVTGGFFGGEMTVIGARPGVGKSAFAQYIAMQFASQGKTVEFFSREMSRVQYGLRMYAASAQVSSSQMRTGNLGEAEIKRLSGAMGRLYGKPMYINTTARTPEEILAVCHDREQKSGLGLIVVDYLQLVSGKGSVREQEVSSVSRALKELSLEFNVPVLALSQLNRAINNSKPSMDNLRESGAIEQDADNIILLHETEEGADGARIIQVIIEKQRQGNTGSIELVFMPETMEFRDRYYG